MPRNKDLKRLVRARMRKTGESYTASRARLLARADGPAKTSAAVVERVAPTPPRPDYAALAGQSDAMIKAKTGCSWERWVFALDRHGAGTMAHRDIAALVSTKYKIDGWWAQAVTVGYERIKGLRAIGQRRDGTYEANKSKTFNVPVGTLFEAWSDAKLRSRWLDGTIGKVRTSIPKRSIRLDGPKGSIIAVGFMSKGPSKSAVAVQHTKLRDAEAANQLKRYWSDRLDALAGML